MWNCLMHVWASYLVGFLGTGSLFSATLCTLPLASVPAATKAADPAPEGAALPLPRVGAPAPAPTPAEGTKGTVVEEPAPIPHELPQQPGGTGVLPVLPFREEAAPMPREQTPLPARFWTSATPRDPSLPDVESLHRQLESLRMERAAMLAEETDLTTAKDLRAARSAEADLQKRIVELIAKVAQQAKKEKETASTSPPTSAAQPVPGPQRQQGREPKPGDTPAPAVPPASSSMQPPPLSSPAASGELPDIIKQSLGTNETVTDAPVDPLVLAQSLFRAGDYTAALNAYRKLDKEDQKPEDRITIQYMMACCLRKLGKMDEASLLYREVANASGNEFVVENAQWYLRSMKERRELEAQLEELRQRRQAIRSRKS
jgi:hypothetical protein